MLRSAERLPPPAREGSANSGTQIGVASRDARRHTRRGVERSRLVPRRAASASRSRSCNTSARMRSALARSSAGAAGEPRYRAIASSAAPMAARAFHRSRAMSAIWRSACASSNGSLPCRASTAACRYASSAASPARGTCLPCRLQGIRDFVRRCHFGLPRQGVRVLKHSEIGSRHAGKPDARRIANLGLSSWFVAAPRAEPEHWHHRRSGALPHRTLRSSAPIADG